MTVEATVADAPHRSDLPTVCIAEDRRTLEPGLRILIASLRRVSEDIRIVLFAPSASADFLSWLSKWEGIEISCEPLEGDFSKYDVKPHALLKMLDAGVSDILWIDSDIVVGEGFLERISGSSPETLIVCEENLGEFHDDPDALRTCLWDLPVGRTLPFSLNSGVLRVTLRHRALIGQWRDLLLSAPYREAQSRSWHERPQHMLGDQEVLTALLGSTEFSSIPLKILRRGPDILQYAGPYGYTLAERLHHLKHGLPPMIHSMGSKPWFNAPESDRSFYRRFMNIYDQMSPYRMRAMAFQQELESTEWLAPRTLVAKVMRCISFGSIPLSGWPMAVLADMLRFSKGLKQAIRRNS